MLAQRDSSVVAAALNLIAGISQKTGVLPYGLTVTNTASETEDKNLLVIASRADVPKNIMLASPLAKNISMPVHGRLPGTLQVEDWKDSLQKLLFDEVTERDPVTPDVASLGTDLRLRPQQAVLCEFESPFASKKTVVLLTAEDGDDILQASLLLQENEVTQQCRDSLVTIDFDGRKPIVQQATLSPSYSVGGTTIRNRISYLVNTYRWPFVALLFGFLAIISLGLTILLKRRRTKRLQMIARKKK